MTVLRATLSYTVSRLVAVAVIGLGLSLAVQPGCRAPGSLGGLYGQTHSAFDEINRALTSSGRL